MVQSILFAFALSVSSAFSAHAATTVPVQKTVANAPAKTAAPAAKTAAVTTQAVSAPAAYLGGRTPASHDINEAIDITGQSRNLSMGLMFQRDKDKVSFGSPRTNYKDKITSSQTNY